MNTSRTHPSAASAFRNHCEYACALEVERLNRSAYWAEMAIYAIAMLVGGLFVAGVFP